MLEVNVIWTFSLIPQSDNGLAYRSLCYICHASQRFKVWIISIIIFETGVYSFLIETTTICWWHRTSQGLNYFIYSHIRSFQKSKSCFSWYMCCIKSFVYVKQPYSYWRLSYKCHFFSYEFSQLYKKFVK